MYKLYAIIETFLCIESKREEGRTRRGRERKKLMSNTALLGCRETIALFLLSALLWLVRKLHFPKTATLKGSWAVLDLYQFDTS